MQNIKKTISAGGIVRKIINNKVYIVLAREQEKKSIILPKGHQEPGETIEETAIREVKEETGLEKIKIIKKLGIKHRLSYKKDEHKTIHYFLFNSIGPTKLPKKRIDGDIILMPKWFPIDKLPGFFWREQKEIIEENLNIII